MDIKPLTYNGRDEGITVTLSTILKPGDDETKISEAILNLFPEASFDTLEEETFPSQRNAVIECLNLSLETFLTLIRQQAILDTAMDAMAKNLDGNSTSFSISRLAAFANKSHLPTKKSLSGVVLQYSCKEWDLQIGSKQSHGTMVDWKFLGN